MLTRKQLIEAIVEARGPDGSKQRTWREVAALLYPRRDPNATAALLNKMYHHPEYDPGPRIRKCLGLLPLATVPACPDCGKAHTIDGVCTAGKAVTVTVTDAPGEMRIRMRPPRKPKPAPDPIWAGITFPRRGDDWGPQPGLVVDLDARAEGMRIALAVLAGHGWTDGQLARAGVALAGALQSE